VSATLAKGIPLSLPLSLSHRRRYAFGSTTPFLLGALLSAAAEEEEMAERLTRIAIVSEDKCKPKKCRQECKKSCPVVKTGRMIPPPPLRIFGDLEPRFRSRGLASTAGESVRAWRIRCLDGRWSIRCCLQDPGNRKTLEC